VLLLLLAQLANGDFADWKEGKPASWEITVGATHGDGPESAIENGPDGGVALSGDGSTRRWLVLSQQIATEPGAFLRLRWESRATGLRREGRQFDNCWVAIAFLGEKQLEVRTRRVLSPAWSPDTLLARAPPGTTRATVRIFLSKTGRLELRNLKLDSPAPAESYDLLVDELRRRYSYLAHKKIDLDALATKHKGDLSALLAELKDRHVWIKAPNRDLAAPFSPKAEPNFDFAVVATSLKEPQQIGKVALAGRTADGFGYLAIATLQLSDAQFQRIEKALDGMLDAPGFILDLRANAGGDEGRALAIAARFADRERVYAKHSVRCGPKPGDLSEPDERRLSAASKTFTKPVVCLVGPVTMSSGEGFAKMMKCLPHVKLIGLTTRGASGNPQPVDLPDGTTVWFSTWVDMLPDGTVTEDRGLAPDIEVRHEAGSDKAFDRAVEELRKRAK
jgi:hypothetical protein